MKKIHLFLIINQFGKATQFSGTIREVYYYIIKFNGYGMSLGLYDVFIIGDKISCKKISSLFFKISMANEKYQKQFNKES